MSQEGTGSHGFVPLHYHHYFELAETGGVRLRREAQDGEHSHFLESSLYLNRRRPASSAKYSILTPVSTSRVYVEVQRHHPNSHAGVDYILG